MKKFYFAALTITAFLQLLITSINKVIAQPLEGDYTINASEATGGNNFASFSDFAAALTSEGISGHVTTSVVVGSGPYNEQVDITDVNGSGPEAVIHLIGNGETLTAVTDTDNRYLLRLSNMNHVVIDDLHLLRDTESSSGFYGVHIFGSGSNITIQNCTANMPGTTSTLVGAYIASGSETSILSAGDFHDIQIIDNTANGGGYGASVYGELGNLSTNILIDGNQFENFNSNGVYLRETDGAVISNNYFDRNAGTVSSCNAIQLAQNANINASVFNNIIEHTQSSNGTMTYRGIYVFNGTGHNVYNNVIQNIQLESGNVTGIEVRTGGIAPNISFNTIRIDHTESTTGNLYGIKEELSNTNSVLRNNLVSIQQSTSGNAAALVLGATSTVTSAINSDYNDLYVPNGNTAMRGTFTPTFYPTLVNWQNISQQDENSFTIDPGFSAIDNSVPTNAAMNDLGVTIPGIETDIEGTMRSDPPDVGAYEFEDCDTFVIDQIEGNTVLCAGEEANFGINLIPGDFTVHWTVEGNANIVSGQGSALVTILFEGGDAVVSVAVENECGTGPEASLDIAVNDLPDDVPEIFGPTQVCAGDIGIGYFVIEQEGTDNFVWETSADSEFNYGFISTAIVVNFGDSTTVVSVTPENECGFGNTTEITVEVNPLPTVELELPDTFCLGSPPLVLTGGLPEGGEYSGPGVVDGVFQTDESGPTFVTITYTYTDSSGCTNSAQHAMFVDICTSINDTSTDLNWNTFPNPFHNILHIELPELHSGPVDVRIFDTKGKQVWQTTRTLLNGEQIVSFSLDHLSAGNYIVSLRHDDFLIRQHIVKGQ